MDIKKELSEKGFVFISKWKPDSTIDLLAESLGEVVKISNYFNHGMIPNIQLIRPKEKTHSSKNQYSSEFGLDAFPLHTDLAHWSKPPKYLMLRCVRGYEQVSTKVLPLKSILELLCELGLRRAVVKPRSIRSCMLPLLFKIDNDECIRWDSMFLVPINDNAKLIKDVMLKCEVWNMATDIKLVNFGDTLILNNHLNLHARSNVPTNCVDREIERIYFN